MKRLLYTRRERVESQQNTKHEYYIYTRNICRKYGPNPIAFPVDNQIAINKSDPTYPLYESKFWGAGEEFISINDSAVGQSLSS